MAPPNLGENWDELELGGEEERRKNGWLGAGTMIFIGKSLVPVGYTNQDKRYTSCPGWLYQPG